ncbi:MAG TPA: hypothetical protein VGM13_05865 [Thermoanaerobaculia bacterium]
MKRILCLTATLAFSACTSAPSPSARAGNPPGEEAVVLALLDRYMHAISAQDVAAMAAMQTADGMTYRARAAEGGGWVVTPRSNASWADPSKVDARTHRERYWSPTVLIRGGIAVVWAPYEFWIDGKTSHCGIDVFDFVKVDGAWRVANAMWTVEPGACSELRPADASTIRPPG